MYLPSQEAEDQFQRAIAEEWLKQYRLEYKHIQEVMGVGDADEGRKRLAERRPDLLPAFEKQTREEMDTSAKELAASVAMGRAALFALVAVGSVSTWRSP